MVDTDSSTIEVLQISLRIGSKHSKEIILPTIIRLTTKFFYNISYFDQEKDIHQSDFSTDISSLVFIMAISINNIVKHEKIPFQSFRYHFSNVQTNC